jgi:hypothetical protein
MDLAEITRTHVPQKESGPKKRFFSFVKERLWIMHIVWPMENAATPNGLRNGLPQRDSNPDCVSPQDTCPWKTLNLSVFEFCVVGAS